MASIDTNYSPVIFEEYQTEQKNVVDIVIEALSEKGDQVPPKKFEWAAKFIIEKYESLQKLDRQKKTVNLQNLLDCLTRPSKRILQDNFTNQVFSRLFIHCHSYSKQIEKSIEIFYKIFSTTAIPAIDDELKRAQQILELAIPCFHLLKEDRKKSLISILKLIGEQPEVTFTNKIRLQAYRMGVLIFSKLDPDKPPPPEYFPSEDTKTDEQSESESESSIESKSSSTSNTYTRPIPIPSKAPSKTKKQSSSFDESRSNSEPLASLFSSTRILEAIQAESPMSITPENQRNRIEQFRSISNFAISFLLDYGPYIVSGASDALLETLHDPQKSEEFVTLLFTVLNPELATNHVNAFSEGFYQLCRTALQKELPILIRDLSVSLVNTIKDPALGPRFAELGIEYLTPLCFKKAPESIEFKKNVMIHILANVKEFLYDLNSCLAEIYKDDSPQMEIISEEILLIHLMNKKIIKKNMHIIVPDGQNIAQIRKNIRNEIQEILQLWVGSPPSSEKEDDAKQALMFFIMNVYFSKMIDIFLSPDTLCIFINRILDQPMQLPDPALISPASKIPDRLEDKYTKRLATILHGMFFEIIRMGETSSMVKTIIELLNPIVESKMNDVAMEAHKKFEEIVRTEFINDAIIAPIIMLDQFLFDKEKPKTPRDTVSKKPSLTKMTSISPPEFREIRHRVDTDIKSRPTLKVKELIENNLSLPIRLALKPLNPEQFCQNLTNRLYRLSQQEMLMKILLAYIKNGIEHALQR